MNRRHVKDWQVGVLVVVGLAMIPLAVYGTLSPCGWLVSEWNWYMMNQEKFSGREMLTTEMAGKIIYTWGPLHCFTRYVKIKAAGGMEMYFIDKLIAIEKELETHGEKTRRRRPQEKP